MMAARVVGAALGLGCLSAPALAYDQGRAQSFVNLASAAYCSAEALQAWNCGSKCISGVSDVKICQGDSTKAFVAKWEGQCLVSFEGTSNAGSLFNDLLFFKDGINWPTCNNCHVHSGFLLTWNSLKSCVTQQLQQLGCPSGSSIKTTGHSLGAAINGLAMLELDAMGWHISESYDFGMPRTGDETFAQMFEQRFGQSSWRVTHHRDPIVHLPPRDLIVDWRFRHKEPEAFYDGDVAQGYKTCTDPLDTTCSWQFHDFVDALYLPDHLKYMGVDSSIFGCSGASTNQTVVV